MPDKAGCVLLGKFILKLKIPDCIVDPVDPKGVGVTGVVILSCGSVRCEMILPMASASLTS